MPVAFGLVGAGEHEGRVTEVQGAGRHFSIDRKDMGRSGEPEPAHVEQSNILGYGGLVL